MRQPLVTVLMPVYNGEKYLCEAIDSILSQTYKNFEFLIINDGSIDKSAELILGYDDARIRCINKGTNSGITSTLNNGLSLAQGKYVARMDSDDISLPHRLEIQVELLEKNPEIGVCGGAIKHFGAASGEYYFPANHDEISSWLLFRNIIAHPTVMLRRSILIENNIFYNELCAAEDYQLWTELGKVTQFRNLHNILLHYRLHSDSISSSTKERLAEGASAVRRQQVGLLKIIPTDRELTIHNKLAYCAFLNDISFFRDTKQWLEKLQKANLKSGFFPEPAFSNVLFENWFSFCQLAKKNNVNCCFDYFRSSLRPFSWRLSFDERHFVVSYILSFFISALAKMKALVKFS